jgi:hypothetical protein
MKVQMKKVAWEHAANGISAVYGRGKVDLPSLAFRKRLCCWNFSVSAAQ